MTTFILPKQKHTFQVGTDTITLYSVYRGRNCWHVRIQIEGKMVGRWLPFESQTQSSIRCIDLKELFITIEKFLLAARDHNYNFKRFCESAELPFDPDDANSKSWGYYDSINSAWRYLESNCNSRRLLTYLLEQSR